MTFQQLLYVIEIAKHGSINQAAEHLFVSQSSISIAVKELEKTLGITIFQRSNRGVLLTQQGSELLKQAKALVDRMNWLDECYHRHQEAKENFQISSAHYSFVTEAFIALLNQQKTNDTHFSLRNTTIYQVIQDVSEFHSDVGVLYMNEHTKSFMEHVFHKHDLRFHLLAQVTPHIFLRKNHPLANKPYLTTDDLKSYPYVCFELPPEVSDDFCEELQMLYLPNSPQIITINDHGTALHLLAKTNAYTSGTGLMNAGYGNDEVISIHYDCEETFDLGWIVHRNTLPSLKRQMFIHSLQDAIKQSMNKV